MPSGNMSRSRAASSWISRSLLVVGTLAQFNSWEAHQINTSICTWEQPRAALVRNTIYLDGGDIYWLPGLDSGQDGSIVAPENYQGILLTYNLSMSFSANSNTSGILLQQPLSKAPGGLGNTNGASPNYYDGAMLANDAQFFLYGGAPFKNDRQYALPDQGAYTSYQAYQYGAAKPQFQPGFHNLELPSDFTRYIAYGAAASAPSENKAYYFSGLTSPTRGPIVQNGNASVTAANVSSTLISVDMSAQNFETWSNKTLPPAVSGRANAEAVWVPVGKQGILVVLGGVTYPDWVSPARKSSNVTGSQALDPVFMSVIDIYDIANDIWYKQPTSAGGGGSVPSARTRGCAVVAPASDFSSFNIYYYGGYDGLHPHDPFFDEVWVLSLPSFTWTRINAGTTSHGRAGHKCFAPYPDQMMIIGGSTALAGANITCLENGPVVMFNLTSGTWMDSYDPTKYGNYGVNEDVRAVIGGSATGGATATKPIPSGWANDALGEVFATAYDRSKLTKYWPYPPAASTARPWLPSDPAPKTAHHSDLPGWARAVLGIVVALVVITCAAVLYFLWKRRQILKRRASGAGTEYSGGRIMSWIMGKSSPEKGHTSMASVSSPIVPEARMEAIDGLASSVTSPAPDSVAGRHEMADTQLVELDGSNIRSELQDTGLTVPEIYHRYSHWTQFGQGQQALTPSPSEGSFSMSGFPVSNNPSLYRGLGDGTPRIDSPPLGVVFPSPSTGRPSPVPELDESGAGQAQHRREVSLPTIDLPYDREENVSPLDARAGAIASPPPPPIEEDQETTGAAGGSQVSQKSSNQEMRHIAFHMKDKKSLDHLQAEDARSE